MDRLQTVNAGGRVGYGKSGGFHILRRVLLLAAILLAMPHFGYGQTSASNSAEQSSFEPLLADDLVVRADPEPRWVAILPEAPIAKPSPKLCPDGFRKPCAMLGGRLYWPSSLSEHDRSWGKAISHPPMLIISSLVVASFIADYKTTRNCLDRGHGREANPLLGQSRAQQLGVGLTVTGLSIWSVGKLKQQGNGSLAVFAGVGATLVHTLAAYHNAVVCSQ